MIGNDLRQYLQQVCSALNTFEVRYMLVGGVAVGFYGYQRISGGTEQFDPNFKHDLDFWYQPVLSNFERIVEALDSLGVDRERLNAIVFDPNRTFLKIPFEHFKIDFLPTVSGLSDFNSAYTRSSKVKIDGNEISIIAYSDLISNKTGMNRGLDLRDIEELERRRNKR